MIKLTNIKSGFTLIELLAVISIISLLSSVILTSVNSARTKVRYSSFIQGLDQFSKLMELEYAAYGTYSGLSTNATTGIAYPTWMGSVAECDLEYGPSTGTSQYLSNALALCKQIVTASGSGYYRLRIGNTSSPEKYSVQGYFDGGLLDCFGSSGKTFKAPYDNGNAYFKPGCSNNP